MKKKKHLLWALIIVIISVVIDQITKNLAQVNLWDKGFVGVIGDAIGFELVYNPGAFLGMFSDARWMFMIPSTVFIVLMCIWLHVKKTSHPLFTAALSLLIGGGIGNMIDRVRLEYVVDFISLKFINFPTFNVADSCVTVGCVLLAIYALLPGHELFDFNFAPSKKTNRNPVSHDDNVPFE